MLFSSSKTDNRWKRLLTTARAGVLYQSAVTFKLMALIVLVKVLLSLQRDSLHHAQLNGASLVTNPLIGYLLNEDGAATAKVISSPPLLPILMTRTLIKRFWFALRANLYYRLSFCISIVGPSPSGSNSLHSGPTQSLHL